MSMSTMDPGSCWDEMVPDGLAGHENFMEILSILDLPMEGLEDDEFVADWDSNKAQCLGPIPSDMLMEPPVKAHGKIHNGPPKSLHGPIAAINETQEQKPFPSCVQEASGYHIRQHNKLFETQDSSLTQTKSPISVLESSGSTSSKSLSIKSGFTIPVRPRSKRKRSLNQSRWRLMSSLPAQNNKQIKKKRVPVRDYEEELADSESRASTKKCSHCEITKTPQWREGPMGPRTLCNACGVRYRSGRLYPEYRPAASPTFVPSLHSNSHKKVIEMRNKGKQHVTRV